VRFDYPTLRLMAGIEPRGASNSAWLGSSETLGLEPKAVEDFAHRFRPTYAGANMGHPYRAVGPAATLSGRPAVSHPAIGPGIEPKSDPFKRTGYCALRVSAGSMFAILMVGSRAAKSATRTSRAETTQSVSGS
jgi:hypothetical protein